MTQDEIKFENMQSANVVGLYHSSPYKSLGHVLHWLYVFATFDIMENCVVGNDTVIYHGKIIAEILWNDNLLIPIFDIKNDKYLFIKEKQDIFLKVLKNKKYVVLEHLLLPDKGFRFWSQNSDDCSKLYNGTIAYKPVFWTDNTDIAIHESRRTGILATSYELEKYYEVYYNNLYKNEE